MRKQCLNAACLEMSDWPNVPNASFVHVSFPIVYPIYEFLKSNIYISYIPKICKSFAKVLTLASCKVIIAQVGNLQLICNLQFVFQKGLLYAASLSFKRKLFS